jgi:hypothetical protein
MCAWRCGRERPPVTDADRERSPPDGHRAAPRAAEAASAGAARAAASGTSVARPALGQLKALAQLPFRTALVIIAIAAAMGALFAAAYSLAPGRATPHHITVGLVGSRAQAVWLACALAALLISARLLRRRPTGR